MDITDWNATGFSPMYYDYGAFQELNITTSGQNPRLQTPGNAVNILIKQATNVFRGQGSVYGTHHSLQSSNIDDALREQGAGAGTPTKYLMIYNLEGGGPIVPDRAWVWGGFGYQDIHRGIIGFLKPGCDNPDDVTCLEDDITGLNHLNVKLNLQLSQNNKFNFLFSRNEKTVPKRGASALRPTLETTGRQGGGAYLYKFEDTQVVSPQLLLTARFAYFDYGFSIEFQEPELRDVQSTYEYSTSTYGRSLGGSGVYGFYTEQPSVIANFDGNYFLTGKAGGDHEMQLGFQFRKNNVENFEQHGGDAVVAFRLGEAREAWFCRPGATSYEITNAAFYFQDVFTRHRWSVKLGLRFDHQTGKSNPSRIPANRVIPDIMPAVDFPGTEPVNPWNNLAPRLGFTYDLTGDAKTLVRAGYSRYYERRDSGDITFNNAAAVSEIDYPWSDLNGDQFVQADEIDTSRILFLNNFNPAAPDSLSSPNVVDPDYRAPVTDELIVGIERELMPDFAIGASYIYRVSSNWIWQDRLWTGVRVPYVGVSAEDFVPVDFAFEGQELTYYELPFPRPAGEHLTNWPDYRQRYQGVEVTGRKRLSNRWMFGFGFTFADQREYYDSEAAVFDPTNVALRDGEQAMSHGAYFRMMNAQWNIKLDGMVELPAGVNLAGKLNGRQGFGFPSSVWTPPRRGGIGRAWVNLQPLGDARYDDFWIADLRVEKSFEIRGSRLSAMLDVFNLFNAATVLSREPRQNLPVANRIYDILAPRVLRIGLRWVF